MRVTDRSFFCLASISPYLHPPITFLKRAKTGAFALLVGAFLLPWLATPGAGKSAEPHDLGDYATHIQDLEAQIRITRYEPKELEKIGSDFKTTYSLHNLTLQYIQPDKIRLEAKSPTRGNALLITNGAMRYFNVPRLHLKRLEDLTNAPGRRQSLLEYSGILSSDTLQFMRGRFVKDETYQGQNAVIFDMTYQGATGGTHYRIWMDPKTRVTLRRDWLDSANKRRASFVYSQPQEVVPGVWMPLRLDVKNSEGALAASLMVSNVKVNQGLDESRFTIAP